jgi:hypothetical protein
MTTLRDRFVQAWKAVGALDSLPDDKVSDFTAGTSEIASDLEDRR